MASVTIDKPAAASGSGGGSFLRANIREYSMLLAFVLIVVLFQYLTSGRLLAPQNVNNLIQQNAFIIVMALGMLLVIVAGHIDLSVGSVAGFIGGLAALLLDEYDWPVWLAIPFTLAVGGAIGAAQGFWVAYGRIPSFIVTLAGMLVFKGLTLTVLSGTTIALPTAFKSLSIGFIPDPLAGVWEGAHGLSLLLGAAAAAVITALEVKGRMAQQAYGHAGEPLPVFVIKTGLIAFAVIGIAILLAAHNGLPNVLILMALLIAIYTFVTTRTTIGRRVYAVGGNAKAAALSGIRVQRLILLTFVNMGVLAALGGLIFAARLGVATAKAGAGFELDVIAACFIGGASASGGVGRIFGAVIGALIMGVLNNGMSILGYAIDVQQMIKGLALLAAVIFDVSTKTVDWAALLRGGRT